MVRDDVSKLRNHLLSFVLPDFMAETGMTKSYGSITIMLTVQDKSKNQVFH